MKNIVLTLGMLLAFVSVNAQVAIEKATANDGAILDFPDSSVDGGINLPRTTDTSGAGTTSGTFLVDKSTKIVKYYGDGAWVDLTGEKSTAIADYDTTLSEASGEGLHVSDGTVNETLSGVVTLSSSSRALQLPVVADVTALPAPPTSGMICYDQASESLAVYNGEKWSFWN